MEAKDALTGTAVAVLMAVFGLIFIVGVILLMMMWLQPGIAHSPSQHSSLFAPQVTRTSLDSHCRREVIQLCSVPRSNA